MKYIYEAIFTPETGGYVVDFPSLNGYTTQGDDRQDAVEMAADLLETVLFHLVRIGEPIPQPTYGHQVPDGGFVAYFPVDPYAINIRFTTKQAAENLCVTPGRVRQLVASGKLRSEKVGRDTFITYDSLAEYMTSHPRKVGRPKKKKVPPETSPATPSKTVSSVNA